MSELPFFKTLHDETKPVGDFGRGSHYSVMRVPIWQDHLVNPMLRGAMLDFSIIWDEDHDERVLGIIERMYFGGLLAPVRFIGERKGTLSVLIDPRTAAEWKPATLKGYRNAIEEISKDQEDPWPVKVNSTLGRELSIIHEDHAKVIAYLQCIDLLWKLGIKPHEIQVAHVEKWELSVTHGEIDETDPDIPF